MKTFKNKSHKNRRYRKNKSRKNKKGGLFNFFSSSKTVPSECDPNNLSMIKDPKSMHANYQTCCPKTFFGSKNSSPYCKQLDLNYQSALKYQNDANEYTGFDPEEINQMKQNPNFDNPNPLQSKKSWYKFWGGKKKVPRKTRRNK